MMRKWNWQLKAAAAMLAFLLVGGALLTLMGAAGTEARLVRHQYYHTYATGAAALDFELGSSENLQIVEIRLTMDGNGNATDTLVVKLDSALGSGYDNTFRSTSLSGVASYYWNPGDTGPILGSTDDLLIDLPNDTSATWCLEVVWRNFY